MISIKDYAKETGVSYEAVRQRIKRYEADLEGHIHRQGRTQFLDDVAVAILNDHRLQNPTVVYDRAAGEEFRELKAELKEAKDLAADYWSQLKAKDGVVQLLVEENKALRLQAASVALLEADNKAAEQKAQEADEAAEKARKELLKTQERNKILEDYAAACEAFNALPGWRRMFEKPPIAPDLQEA